MFVRAYARAGDVYGCLDRGWFVPLRPLEIQLGVGHDNISFPGGFDMYSILCPCVVSFRRITPPPRANHGPRFVVNIIIMCFFWLTSKQVFAFVSLRVCN